MYCKNCGKEFDQRKSTNLYCGNACKQSAYRNNRNTPTVTDVTVTNPECVTVNKEAQAALHRTAENIHSVMEQQARTASYQDTIDNPNDYAARALSMDDLNWGPYMTAEQLEQAGLRGNRVTIPGDWDYVGVAR